MKVSLTQMQREKPKEPFVLTVNVPAVDNGERGQVPAHEVDVEFADPKRLHWTKLALLDDGSPVQAIQTLVEDPEQYQAFRSDPDLDGEALQWVMEQYRAHYGLGGPGESGGSTSS